LSDEWAEHIEVVAEFVCDNFKRRSMGLVCNFAQEINRVYTAVFPSKAILQKILDNGVTDAMLFVHHPAIWDIRKSPKVFQQMDKELLARLKEKRISIYNLHVPLDNYGSYSTSVSLAKALDINPEEKFAPYFGALCGIFGKTNLIKISDLKKKFQQAVGHNMGLYKYGSDTINGWVVAVVAGGGNSIEVLSEVATKGVNVFVTGITAKNDFSKSAHEFAQEHKINILGGTHYSTEKFACITILDYFKNLGLPAEFIEDWPVMEDM